MSAVSDYWWSWRRRYTSKAPFLSVVILCCSRVLQKKHVPGCIKSPRKPCVVPLCLDGLSLSLDFQHIALVSVSWSEKLPQSHRITESNKFIDFFVKYLLYACNMPGIVQGARNRRVNGQRLYTWCLSDTWTLISPPTFNLNFKKYWSGNSKKFSIQKNQCCLFLLKNREQSIDLYQLIIPCVGRKPTSFFFSPFILVLIRWEAGRTGTVYFHSYV